MNIVELILKSLSGDTLKQLAALAGQSPESLQKALSAIVPLLLSGVGSVASKPDGAEKIMSTLKSVNELNPDDYGKILAGGKAEEMSQKGTNILEVLLGKQGLAALLIPLAKYLASNTDMVKKLLSFAAPLVMSIISKQMKSGGLDIGSLLKLILSQKGNIANALPKGLASDLVGVQGLGDLASFATGSAQAVGDAAKAAAAESTNWLVPGLVALALIAAGLWYLSQGNQAGKPGAGQTNTPADVPLTPAPGGMGDVTAAVPVPALTEKVTAYFNSLGGALDEIKDEETAKAALPQVQKMADQFGEIKGLIDTLPAAAKSGVTELLESSQKTLTEKADKVLGIPGVGELLKPILDGLLEKVAALLKG